MPFSDMPFPDVLLRGISNESDIFDGQVLAQVFQFNPPKEPREDNHNECSINWKDEDCAIDLILHERKVSGQIKYSGGVAILSKEEIDKLRTRRFASVRLDYERRAIEGNDFHGNILLHKDTTEAVRRLISGVIAYDCVMEVIPPRQIAPQP